MVRNIGFNTFAQFWNLISFLNIVLLDENLGLDRNSIFEVPDDGKNKIVDEKFSKFSGWILSLVQVVPIENWRKANSEKICKANWIFVFLFE